MGSAQLLKHLARYDDAGDMYRRALGIREAALGADHPKTAGTLNNLAVVLVNKGDYDGAEALYRRALGIRERAQGADHPDTVSTLNNLAGVLDDKGDYDGAEAMYRRALGVREMSLGADHPRRPTPSWAWRSFSSTRATTTGLGRFTAERLASMRRRWVPITLMWP